MHKPRQGRNISSPRRKPWATNIPPLTGLKRAPTRSLLNHEKVCALHRVIERIVVSPDARKKIDGACELNGHDDPAVFHAGHDPGIARHAVIILARLQLIPDPFWSLPYHGSLVNAILHVGFITGILVSHRNVLDSHIDEHGDDNQDYYEFDARRTALIRFGAKGPA